MSAHPLHAAFDRIVAELEAHPRVHVACVSRGAPRVESSIHASFAKHFGVMPGDDVVSFYAERDGCALMWLDREEADRAPARHRRIDAIPTIAEIDDRMTEGTHLVVMPPLARVFGDDGLDYACMPARIGGERERYERSFVGFDFVGDYYTPAFLVERGRVRVQVGDDHGVFDDGRPTVSFDTYLGAVVATYGSNAWRNRIFGLVRREPADAALRSDPIAWLAEHPLTIDALLGPTAAEREAARTREAAIAAMQPTDPRLRALADAIRTAKSVTYELQKDGRTLVRVERADGGRQLTFLKPDERAQLERALGASDVVDAQPGQGSER